MTSTGSSRERGWLVALALSFGFGLAASWERWGNPLIDNGREMNQPLRMVNGERLYADIPHIYGPFSPWVHAELYRAFGPSLGLLYADGIISASIILALVYWLGRRIMPPAGAAAATLSVMWLCAFRQSGVYFLPYSYNALHGTVFGLVTLSLLVVALKRAKPAPWFLLAGLAAGLTLLSKTEMGFAAEVAGLTAAAVIGGARPSERARFAALFLGPSLGLTIGVYALIAYQVGWSTLVKDNWLLLYNISPELTYYNNRIAGFDRPLKNLGRMLIAAAKLGIIATIVGAIAQLIGGSDRRRGWRLLALAGVVFVILSITTGLDWDKGPFLAIPFLLIGMLLAMRREPILMLYSAYALASVARMILHVRSGGTYASYLLPISVVIFTYLWVERFPRAFDAPRVQRAAAAIGLTLLFANAIITAGIVAQRYRTRATAPIVTPRGTMVAERNLAQAWNEALVYIDTHTRPTDTVAVVPEGTSLNFMSGRRNPLREEINTPGFLDAAGEARAIRRLQEAHTPLILVANRMTTEFGPAIFGRDYDQHLMDWIETHYERCAMFGPDKDPNLRIGAPTFFLRAYCAQRPL